MMDFTRKRLFIVAPLVVLLFGVFSQNASESTSEKEVEIAIQTVLDFGLGMESDNDSDQHDNTLSHQLGHLHGMDLPRSYKLLRDSMKKQARNCSGSEVYRRADGLCNNMKNPLWGAGLHDQERLLPNAYDDGKGTPRQMGENESYLPSPRKVSVECFPPNEESREYLDRDATQMNMQWGQYIDHDIVFTELQAATNCCVQMAENGTHPDINNMGPCFPIPIAPEDRYFKTSCMPFRRSFSIPIHGAHQQITGVTSFVDGSTVYGSHYALQKKLRTFVHGKLKVSDTNTFPRSPNFKCRKDLLHGDVKTCPMAGDGRVNVFGGLTILHLMFVREHNRIADKLKQVNRNWDDEKLFQETRKIIAALHQKINYEDYLPEVLGRDVMKAFGLQAGEYHYDPKVNPSIINEFAVAAFRFGHSQINAFLRVKIHNDMPISTTFFQPWLCTKTEKQIEDVLRQQCRKRAQKVDKHFTTEVTDKLFLGKDGPGLSTDLAARNVQRGRDHGTQPYTQYLEMALKFFYNTCVKVDDIKLPGCIANNVYDTINDIDLFVGGLAEGSLPGALVGPTFAYIIGEQFRRLKYGDRFFYETKNEQLGFTPDQLAEIKGQSLSHIICRNTVVKKIAPNVFRKKSLTNPTDTLCEEFHDMNLSLWVDNDEDNDDDDETKK